LGWLAWLEHPRSRVLQADLGLTEARYAARSGGNAADDRLSTAFDLALP
jgi:hypothetical protein